MDEAGSVYRRAGAALLKQVNSTHMKNALVGMVRKGRAEGAGEGLVERKSERLLPSWHRGWMWAE